MGNVIGKYGIWVGIELDEPLEYDEDVFGLFECNKQHGLILRYSQVKQCDDDRTSDVSSKVVNSQPSSRGSSNKMLITDFFDFKNSNKQSIQ